MEFPLLRFRIVSGLSFLLLLAACSSQEPDWERYRAPRLHGGTAPGDGSSTAGVDDRPAPTPARRPGSDPKAQVLADPNPFTDLDELGPYLEGTASWYGPGFHGELTASGEVYNQYGMTAAHPMLPLGTKVEVENLGNGHKVWLRINDRGPYKKARILDLSKLAAERLGIVEEGTAEVRIRVIKWPEAVEPGLGLRAYRQFVVQVASKPDPAEAEIRRADYQSRFPSLPFQIDRPPGSQYTVVAGPYDDEPTARVAALGLQQRGVSCLVRSYRK
jgi:rare lipoprotein A